MGWLSDPATAPPGFYTEGEGTWLVLPSWIPSTTEIDDITRFVYPNQAYFEGTAFTTGNRGYVRRLREQADNVFLAPTN